MRVGAALFLIAIGAILKFAVTTDVSGVSLPTVGVILMIVGGVGLLFELIWWGTHRDATIVSRSAGTTYVDPPDRVERRY